MNILIDSLLTQFFIFQKCKVCLSKMIFYQYFVESTLSIFYQYFALIETASSLKTFYLLVHSTKNLKKV